MSRLGDYIRSKRESMGFSVRKLGEVCGLSYSYISQLERGTDPRTGKTVYPTVQTLNKLAGGLNVSVEELIPLIQETLEEDINNSLESDVLERMKGIDDTSENASRFDFEMFVQSDDNKELIKLLMELKNSGYSNVIIKEWLTSLKNTLENIKLSYQEGVKVVWNDSLKPGEYSKDELKSKAKKLEKKLNDPNFIPPWEK